MMADDKMPRPRIEWALDPDSCAVPATKWGVTVTPRPDSPTGAYSDGVSVRYAIAGHTVTREEFIAWRDRQDAETQEMFTDYKLAQIKVGDESAQ